MSTLGSGRGRPPPPLRSRTFALGAAAVLGSASVVVLVTLGPTRSSPGSEPPDAPFDPGGLWAVGPSGDSLPVRRQPGTILLYVTEECPHCRAELRSWQARVVARGAVHLPLVVLSPSSTPGDPAYLPGVFRRRWVHDRDGSIAAALGVGAVPLVVVFGSGGQVVAARVGRSSEQEIDHLLRLLNPDPRREEGS